MFKKLFILSLIKINYIYLWRHTIWGNLVSCFTLSGYLLCSYIITYLVGLDIIFSTLISFFEGSVIYCDSPNSWYNYDYTYNKFITYIAFYLLLIVFSISFSYFYYIKVFLRNLVYNIYLNVSLLLFVLKSNPLLLLYIFVGIYYGLLLLNIVGNLSLLVLSVLKISVFSILNISFFSIWCFSLLSLQDLLFTTSDFYLYNYDLIDIDDINLGTEYNIDSTIYFTTPSEGGGAGSTGNTTGTGYTGGTTTAGPSTGGTTTAGEPRGPRTDGIMGMDFSNNSFMDKSVSTHPCPRNNGKPHLWLEMNCWGLEQYGWGGSVHPGDCDKCFKKIPFSYFDCTECGARLCTKCTDPPVVVKFK